MRTITALAVGWLMTTAVLGQDEALKEQQRFQGAWTFVSVELEGKTLDFFKDAKAVVKGGKVSVTFANGGGLIRRFKLFPDTNPRCVDFLPDTGKGTASEGIYELKDNHLKLLVNVSDGGRERPSGFADKKKSGHIYYVVERAK
jgi:uncharacterized protein (TIGR03067 family)